MVCCSRCYDCKLHYTVNVEPVSAAAVKFYRSKSLVLIWTFSVAAKTWPLLGTEYSLGGKLAAKHSYCESGKHNRCDSG